MDNSLQNLNLGDFINELRKNTDEKEIIRGFKNGEYLEYGHGNTYQNYPNGVKVEAEYGDPTESVLIGSRN